jgi:hypothetical protein
MSKIDEITKDLFSPDFDVEEYIRKSKEELKNTPVEKDEEELELTFKLDDEEEK